MIRTASRSLMIAVVVAAGAGTSALADFNYTDFTSTSGLNLVGAAQQNSNRLLVTPSQLGQAGAVWYGTQQRVSGGFDTTMRIKIEDRFGGGADGMALVIQNSSATAIGGSGGAMGYASNPMFGMPGITNSLAVEFDMWNNSEKDWPDGGNSHISVQSMGLAQNSPENSASMGIVGSTDLSDGATHTLRVNYTGGLLSVYIDGALTPALQVAVNLDSLLALNPDSDGVGKAWVGITAATGGNPDRQAHVLESWSFTGTPIPAPGAAALLAPALAMGMRRRRN